jgi:hypothetical protein
MKRHPLFAAVIALLVVIGAGAAYAYFTAANGSSSGHATNGTLAPVTVDAFVGGDAPSSTLLPGGSADVILRIKNQNAFPVTLVTVTGGPAAITVDSGHSGCTVAGVVSFTNQTGRADTIAASPTTTLVHLANAASMTSAAASACQGATFNIPVTITVHK